MDDKCKEAVKKWAREARDLAVDGDHYVWPHLPEGLREMITSMIVHGEWTFQEAGK